VVFTVDVVSVAGTLLTRTAARASQIQTDVNARDAHGMTPLDYAVEQNDIGSVLALIHAGGDVNARSNTGRTALSWAALHGYIEIARALAHGRCRPERQRRTRGHPVHFGIRGWTL